MKIVQLTCENIKRLVAVEIRPDGNMVEITGKNAQGKTSILDSIQWAIEGAKHIQAQPVRKGQKEARIRLDLGEVIVTRKFRKLEDGTTDTSVVVEGANGARFPSPQRMLDSFLGALTFDPLAFSRMAAKEQFDALRRFVPDVDFAAIEGLNRRDFESRTENNRRAKEARSAAALITVPDSLPAEPINSEALVEDLQKAGDHNAQIEASKSSRERAAEQIKTKSQEAATLRASAATLRAQADGLDAEAAQVDLNTKRLQERLDGLPPLADPIDTKAVRDKIGEANRVNAQVAKRAEREGYLDKATKLDDLSKRLTEAMEARTKDKLAKIAAAKLPIEGLGFGDGIVLLNGVPFDQASDAEQLRASVAIAMAGNPKLRVIRVRDGSLLDADGMRLLAELADANDMQVWVERVASDGKVGFVIEDGQVRQTPAAPAEAVA